MTNEEYEQAVARADDELDMLKDTCHDQYDRIQELENRINKVIDTLEKRINEIENQEWKSYTGQTDEEYLEEQKELLIILRGDKYGN